MDATTTAVASTDADLLRLDFNDTWQQQLMQQRLLLLSKFNRCMFSESAAQDNLEFCREFFDSYFENQNMQYKIPMLIAFCLLFIVGVTGNALVILSIAIFPTMRSRTNIFLLNLAISDLLIFFMCLPITAYNVLSTRWAFGVAICKLSPFLQGVSVSVSIGSLASMSIKRYMVIRYPMTAKERMSNRAMCLWVAAIWLVSVLLCCPIPAAYKLSRHDFYWKSSVEFCVEDWQESATRKTAYTLFLFGALYLVPLIAMTIFYSMLGRTLVSTVKFARQVTSDAQQSGLRALSQGRVKVSKIMIALLMAFAVCWLPYHAVTIFVDLRGSTAEEPVNGGGGGGGGNLTMEPLTNATAPPGQREAAARSGGQEVNVVVTTVLPICLLLGYANSAINPLCLVLISSKFKKYFRLILCCNCRADQESQREQAQLYSMYSRAHPPSSAKHDSDHHCQHHLTSQQHQHPPPQHQHLHIDGGSVCGPEQLRPLVLERCQVTCAMVEE